MLNSKTNDFLLSREEMKSINGGVNTASGCDGWMGLDPMSCFSCCATPLTAIAATQDELNHYLDFCSDTCGI